MESKKPRFMGAIELAKTPDDPLRTSLDVKPSKTGIGGWTGIIFFCLIFLAAAYMSKSIILLAFTVIFLGLFMIALKAMPALTLGKITMDKSQGQLTISTKGPSIFGGASMMPRTGDDTYNLSDIKSIRSYKTSRWETTGNGHRLYRGQELSLETSDGVIPVMICLDKKKCEASANLLSEMMNLPIIDGKPTALQAAEDSDPHHVTKGGQLFAMMFFGIFLLAGVFVLYMGIQSLNESMASDNWPTTPGTITYSDVQSHRGKSTTYGPDVRYAYTANGIKYDGKRVFISQYSTSDYSWAKETAAKYPVGGEATVYYDPADPSKAALEKGVNWMGVGIPLLVGAVFSAVGLLGVGSSLMSLLGQH